MASAAEQLASNLNFGAFAKADELKKRIWFTLGALVPLLAILLLATDRKIPGTVMLAAVALAVTGWTSARLGGASPARAILRNVGGGLLAMAITFAIGRLFGASVS